MKRIVFALLLILFSAGLVCAEYVSGHFRKDGTYVEGYYRSDKNNTVTDNFSYKNNSNPYTGETGHNYYRDDNSSEYYGTTNNNCRKPQVTSMSDMYFIARDQADRKANSDIGASGMNSFLHGYQEGKKEKENQEISNIEKAKLLIQLEQRYHKPIKDITIEDMQQYYKTQESEQE